jgi:hypothetical protein
MPRKIMESQEVWDEMTGEERSEYVQATVARLERQDKMTFDKDIIALMKGDTEDRLRKFFDDFLTLPADVDQNEYIVSNPMLGEDFADLSPHDLHLLVSSFRSYDESDDTVEAHNAKYLRELITALRGWPVY